MSKKIIVIITHYGCYDDDSIFTELSISLVNMHGEDISEPNEPVFTEYIIIDNPEIYFCFDKHKIIDKKIVLPYLSVNKNIFTLIKNTLKGANNFSHWDKYNWEIYVCSHYDMSKPRLPFCEFMVQSAVFDDICTEMLGSESDVEKYFKFERNPELKIFSPCSNYRKDNSLDKR